MQELDLVPSHVRLYDAGGCHCRGHSTCSWSPGHTPQGPVLCEQHSNGPLHHTVLERRAHLIPCHHRLPSGRGLLGRLPDLFRPLLLLCADGCDDVGRTQFPGPKDTDPERLLGTEVPDRHRNRHWSVLYSRGKFCAYLDVVWIDRRINVHRHPIGVDR